MGSASFSKRTKPNSQGSEQELVDKETIPSFLNVNDIDLIMYTDGLESVKCSYHRLKDTNLPGRVNKLASSDFNLAVFHTRDCQICYKGTTYNLQGLFDMGKRKNRYDLLMQFPFPVVLVSGLSISREAEEKLSDNGYVNGPRNIYSVSDLQSFEGVVPLVDWYTLSQLMENGPGYLSIFIKPSGEDTLKGTVEYLNYMVDTLEGTWDDDRSDCHPSPANLAIMPFEQFASFFELLMKNEAVREIAIHLVEKQTAKELRGSSTGVE